MPVTQTVLRRLAVPLNRGDFPAFVQAVQDLPSADRDVLAILGACDLLGHAATLNYLSQNAARDLVGWAIQFRGTYIGGIVSLAAWLAWQTCTLASTPLGGYVVRCTWMSFTQLHR